MINDLIEYGKWLSNNDLDDFGKDTKDGDYVLLVTYDNSKFNLNKIILKGDFNNSIYFENSIFYNDFLISTDQRFIIPSKSNLLGLSPFFIKLDNDFIKRSGINKKNIEKFQKKVERSIKSNKNNKEFVAVLKNVYSSLDDFVNGCSFNDDKKNIFEDFLTENSLEFFSSLIISYYEFILENIDLITSEIINLKKSEEYVSRPKPNFYLACCFGDELDLLNDLFIFYSKIFKKREEKVKDYSQGNCSFCGEPGITYSSLGSFAISKSASFNFSENMQNSRLRVCKLCNSYLRTAEDNLKKSLKAPMLIIPKSKGVYDYESFFKISNLEDNSFSKINEFLKDNSNDFNYDLVLYKEGNGNTYVINKYVENYQTFLINFNKEIKLYDDGLNYLFGEKYFEMEDDKKFVNNLFDLESIFKSFFIKFEGDTIKFPMLYTFCEIYTKDLTGKSGILYGFDSRTILLFTKYMHSIFNFIYELNEDALNRKMINEIVSNILFKFQRNSGEKTYKCSILKNLNYYFMIVKEFLGESMLNEDNVFILKEIFSKYNKDSTDVKITDEDEEIILNNIKNEVSLKYYLLGQFIALIDNSKRIGGKNSDVFSNFILNVNKNNIKKLFTTEILQKNNFYIKNMNKKGKFIFKILENSLNDLFDEENFYFEDYVILMFTGYYSENILSTNYGVKN